MAKEYEKETFYVRNLKMNVWFDYGVDAVSGSLVVNAPEVLRCVSEGAIFTQLHHHGVRLLTMLKEVKKKRLTTF